jgi:UDP-N-acetylmuramate--alanine ligase
MTKCTPAMFGKTEHIHFIGIGGIGMSGLALIMHNLGFRVTGSDVQPSDITRSLKKIGAKISYKHRPENVTDADVVVYSTAVQQDNPELAEARRKGIPVIHRAELLAELTRMKIAVCVSGTHGKTTTTSIIDAILQKGGLSPTTVVGGIIKGKSQARVGKGVYLVCEADESDKSFLRLHPSYAVITNIEAEHLEYYANLDDIKEHFMYFASHVPFWGCVFLCIDSRGALDIKPNIQRRVLTYGMNENSELRPENIHTDNTGTVFDVRLHKKRVGRFRCRLLGTHNISNTVAAIGVGLELGVPVTKMKKALDEFEGVHRRIEYHGEAGGVIIYDDYGHHPTEVAVTLQTLRETHPTKRIISIFQPHRYTRTYHLFNDFAFSFFHADLVVMTDIYAAHELPIAGITGEALAKRVRKEQVVVYYIPDFDEIIRFIKKIAQPGDVVVVQGAGNIVQLATRLKGELE